MKPHSQPNLFPYCSEWEIETYTVVGWLFALENQLYHEVVVPMQNGARWLDGKGLKNKTPW